MVKLILYSKAGCHLCEGLQEKLEQISSLQFDLEVRDITTQADWFRAYEYEVPVLFLSPADPALASIAIPRPSPRATVSQLEQMLQKYF
jgi:Glutaredoxin-like domain (DUF836)